MRILYVVNNPSFFLQQHLPVAEASRDRGHDVHIAAPDWSGADEIRMRGFAFHEIGMKRGRLNPINEVRSVIDLIRLYRSLAPDLVHHLTHKPVLYGTLAARAAAVPAVLNANTGLGYLFIDQAASSRILRKVFELMFRAVLNHPNQTDLFLNPDDQADFAERGMTQWERSAVVTGPGVDPDEFPDVDEPVAGPPIVVLPARLLIHKGVREFVDAARLLRSRNVAARFVLVGDTDHGNNASIGDEEIEQWTHEGIVEHWGYRSDMAAVYAQCAVCVLPSYREGLGRVLIEAASTGRPLVAFDVPGCREVVQDGFNGLLVPPRDIEGLADAIHRLVEDREMRKRFGTAGRALVLERFSIGLIVKQTLAFHDRLLGLDDQVEEVVDVQDEIRSASEVQST